MTVVWRGGIFIVYRAHKKHLYVGHGLSNPQDEATIVDIKSNDYGWDIFYTKKNRIDSKKTLYAIEYNDFTLLEFLFYFDSVWYCFRDMLLLKILHYFECGTGKFNNYSTANLKLTWFINFLRLWHSVKLIYNPFQDYIDKGSNVNLML